MVGDVLPDINPDLLGELDPLAAIGMSPEFVEATSGDTLGLRAAESAGASAAGATLELPFGDDFMIQRSFSPDAAKQTPATVKTTATDPETGKATELETDPE